MSIRFLFPLYLVFLLSHSKLAAQAFSMLQVPVTQGGKTLPTPWLGGLSAPQLSAVDLNDDGLDDLHVFDREGNVQLTFLQVRGSGGGGRYQYAPEYATTFPPVENWMLVRDYNGDGIEDIFCYSDIPGVDGIIVYTGFYLNKRIAFRRFVFDGPFGLLPFPLPNGNLLPLYVSRADYPAVDDADCDGDLDILTFNLAGGYVEFFQNQSIELGYKRDSLIFRLKDNCWGGFYESGLSEKLDLAPSAGACYRGSSNDLAVTFRHAGSTLLTLDADGDKDLDMILGDVSFTNLSFLRNGGSCTTAWMNQQDNQFPSYDKPADIPYFPAAFYLDLNFDGKKDLAVAPNAELGSEDQRVIWWYENTGSSEQPRFTFRKDDFLVGDMIDLGTGANPVFVDYNADGKLDLLVGNQSKFQESNERNSRVFLYLNTGSPTLPAFTLTDDDWLKLSQFGQNAFGFTPAFGDLDQDGDLDLVMGEEAGQLFFAENTAGTGKPMTFGPLVYGYQGIDVGLASTPQIADLNGDGLPDLIVGERSGNVNYFQNTGSKGKPAFQANPSATPNTAFLGQIDTRQPGYVSGYSAPVLFRQNGAWRLLTGTEDLGLRLYSGIENQLYGNFKLENASVSQLRPGSNTRPALADVDADGLLEMAVGTARGGMLLYKTPWQADGATPTQQAPESEQLNFHPNPARDWTAFDLGQEFLGSTLQVNLYQMTGAITRQWQISGSRAELDLSGLPRGLYVVRIKAGERVFVGKLVRE